MIAFNYFSQGFFFGLGFFLSFVAIIFCSVITFGKILKKGKELELQKKLSLNMLEEYMQNLSNKGKFEEAKDFKVYIESFKKNYSMDYFFKTYKIVEKRKFVEGDDEDEDNLLFGKIEKTYYIKKRKD